MFQVVISLLIVTNLKLIQSVTFENVSVFVRNVDNTEKVIFLEWDNSFNKYIKPETTEIVVIKNQFVPELGANAVADLPELRTLSLPENHIREIEPGTFRNLPKLELVNLTNNDIEEIKNGVFTGLPMKELYLQRNNIFRIGHKAFNNLRLKTISLNYNKITRWNREWFTGTFVQYLNMGNNLIEELPPNSFYSMADLPKGTMNIGFSNNRLKIINRNVFNGYNNFNSVFLDGNLIEHLQPGVFDGVNYIKVLNLNNNSISQIDVNLFKDMKIDILMLEDNKLTCLSTEMFKVKESEQLEELDIDGNPITCACVKIWMDWRAVYSHPSIYHIVNLEEDCI